MFYCIYLLCIVCFIPQTCNTLFIVRLDILCVIALTCFTVLHRGCNSPPMYGNSLPFSHHVTSVCLKTMLGERSPYECQKPKLYVFILNLWRLCWVKDLHIKFINQSLMFLYPTNKTWGVKLDSLRQFSFPVIHFFTELHALERYVKLGVRV